MDRAAGDIDVFPDQAEQLGMAHPGEDGGCDQGAVRRQAPVQEVGDLLAPENPRRSGEGVRTLVRFELVDGTVSDPAVANSEPDCAL
jgi:hypothetical protein